MTSGAARKAEEEIDVVVVGAGFAGLFALHRLRELGYSCRLFEAGQGVGGTWYWNRYPGARTDSHAYVYQYWFSDDLLKDWRWSERFPSQPETERYLNHVADRFDLRKDIAVDARVSSAHWCETRQRWSVRVSNGEAVEARFVVACVGLLSEPKHPDLPGLETFQGQLLHTARWPKQSPDLKGKRVGIIGTGATGIQVIQSIAHEVESLHVFQRTANYVLPMSNPKLDEADWRDIQARYPQIKEQVWKTFIGFDYDVQSRAWDAVSPAERAEVFESLWNDGSLRFWVGNFAEIFSDEDKNAEASDFIRAKMRAKIRNPAVADLLTPQHGFGTRRVPLENGYLEAFNRPNVHLVDVKTHPLKAVTEHGVRTDVQDYPLDVLITATGFDGSTGSLTRIDIRGRNGVSLRDTWSQDLRTSMGLQVHGFPNLFTTTAPLAPSAAFCNMPTCLQQQVSWIADCIDHVATRRAASIEPTAEFEQRWVAHHDEVASATLIPKVDSWWTGANVKGKSSRLISYVGGVGTYQKLCDDLASSGYEGFSIR